MLCMAVALARGADRRIGAEQELGLKRFTHVGVLGEPGCWRGGVVVVVFGGCLGAGCWGLEYCQRCRGAGLLRLAPIVLPMEAGGGMREAGWDATHSSMGALNRDWMHSHQWICALIRTSSRKPPKTTHRSESSQDWPDG